MGHVLRAAGMDFNNLVSCHVQLADMGQYKAMNEVYGSYFTVPSIFPPRTTLEFPGLPGGAKSKFRCIAYGDKSRNRGVVPPAGAIPAAMGPYSPESGQAIPSTYPAAAAARQGAMNSIPPSKAKRGKPWRTSARFSRLAA